MDIVTENLGMYYAIYSQLYENPFMSLPDTAQNANRSVQKVSQLLVEMYYIQPASHPKGISRYAVRFLFCSQYQRQLIDTLGMVPSTSVFFSTKYLLARVSVLHDTLTGLFGFISESEQFNYFPELPRAFSLFAR